MDTAEAGTRASDSPVEVVYDGFMSYSHTADDLLAPRLQAGLQRFAKPWWKRRALRIFRDEASLSANPHLWSSITEALDRSGWFVLLLSPDAAESPWVNREIEYWLEHKDSGRIIPVLTDGEFAWSGGDIVSDAAPPSLQGVFADEPRWVDLRFARSEEQLDLKNPRFSAGVADVASALRGVPKDELESEEVKQHRRTVRTAWAAGITLAALVVLAVAAAIFAFNQQQEAEEQAAIARASAEAEAAARQEADTQRGLAQENELSAREQAELAQREAQIARSREFAAAAVGVLDENPELSMMLALASIGETPPGSDASPAGVLAMREALQANRVLSRFPVPPGGNSARLSSDGATVFRSSDSAREVTAFDVATGSVHWTYHDPTTIDGFSRVGLSPDEQWVTVTVFDIPLIEDDTVPVDPEGNDEHPARVVVLDASTGEPVEIVELGDCPFPAAHHNGFSPDGQWFSVWTGTASCGQDPDSDWVSVFDTSTWEEAFRLQVEGGTGDTVVFSADSSRILLYGAPGPTEVRSFPDLELVTRFDFSEWASLSPDGETVVRSLGLATASRPLIVDAVTGERIGFLESMEQFLSNDPLSFSPDGSKIAATTRGADFVFDATDGRLLAKLGAGQGETFAHSFNGDGSLLLTTGTTDLLLWDLGSGLEELGVPIQPAGVDAVWVNPNQVVDGPSLAVKLLFPDATGEVLDSSVVTAFLDGETGQVLDQLFGFGAQLPDGRFIVARATEDEIGERLIGPVEVWDPQLDSFTALTQCVATEKALDQVTEINCAEGQPFYGASAFGPSWPFGSLVAARDGSVLAAESYAPVGSERSIRVWDASTLEIRSEFEVPHGQHIWAAGQKWLMTFDTDIFGWLVVYDIDSGKVIAQPDTFESGFLWAYAVDPELSLFYASELQGNVWVFDTSTWETIAVWKSHDAPARGLALSPDGARLVTTGEDDLVKVWDVSHIREISDSQAPPLLDRIPAPFPSDAAFLSENRVAVFLADGAKWLAISLSVDDLVAEAEQRLTRGFTAGECATYQIDPCPTTPEAIRSGRR